MASALLVHVHGGVREGPGHVTHAAGVVEMDVGDGDAGQVGGGDAVLVQGRQQRRDGRLAARLDQHRGRALNQVSRRHASSHRGAYRSPIPLARCRCPRARG